MMLEGTICIISSFQGVWETHLLEYFFLTCSLTLVFVSEPWTYRRFRGLTVNPSWWNSFRMYTPRCHQFVVTTSGFSPNWGTWCQDCMLAARQDTFKSFSTFRSDRKPQTANSRHTDNSFRLYIQDIQTVYCSYNYNYIQDTTTHSGHNNTFKT